MARLVFNLCPTYVNPTSEDMKPHIIIFELFITNLLRLEHQRKTARLADSFEEPMA